MLTVFDQQVALPDVILQPGERLQVISPDLPLLGPVRVSDPSTPLATVTAQPSLGVLGQVQASSAPVSVTLQPTNLDPRAEPALERRLFLPWVVQ